MKQKIVHIFEQNADIISYESHLRNLSDNSAQRSKMKRLIKLAMLNELTEKQRICMEGYYFSGKKMKDIAFELGVAPSTVTRHIKCGTAKLKNIAQYYQ